MQLEASFDHFKLQIYEYTHSVYDHDMGHLTTGERRTASSEMKFMR